MPKKGASEDLAFYSPRLLLAFERSCLFGNQLGLTVKCIDCFNLARGLVFPD